MHKYFCRSLQRSTHCKGNINNLHGIHSINESQCSPKSFRNHLLTSGIHARKPLANLQVTLKHRYTRLRWCGKSFTQGMEWCSERLTDKSRLCLHTSYGHMRVQSRLSHRQFPDFIHLLLARLTFVTMLSSDLLKISFAIFQSVLL